MQRYFLWVTASAYGLLLPAQKEALKGTPLWIAYPTVLLAAEFCFYWVHRWAHAPARDSRCPGRSIDAPLLIGAASTSAISRITVPTGSLVLGRVVCAPAATFVVGWQDRQRNYAV